MILHPTVPLCLSAALGVVVSFAIPIQAQLPSSELHSIHPPIVAAGKTTEIKLNGVNLDRLTGLQFSAPGITAKPILLPSTEFRKQPGQDGTRFELVVPKGQKSEFVEVRAAGYFGLTPTRPLLVVPSDSAILSDSAGAVHHKIETAPDLPLEARAWGTTDANQTDWWKVAVKKGDRLLVHCHTERIDSQADASLKLVDGRGFELEASRDVIGRDPMIDFTAPMDGHYWVGVHDFLYNGGTNFPYLLQVSKKPWIDSVFPPVITQSEAQPGSEVTLTLFGRNLPGDHPNGPVSVAVKAPASPADGGFNWRSPDAAFLSSFPFQYRGSPPFSIGLTPDPVIVVPDGDSHPTITPPCEIAARFEKDGDSDTFLFQAKKGTTYWVEAIAHRLAGRIDPYVLVEKGTTKEDGTTSFAKVRDADDHNGYGGSTFPDRSLDSVLSFTADQDGPYRVQVINHFASGSRDHIYRLAIREARPDVELIAVAERPYLDQRQAFPSAPLLRKGGTFPLRVLVKRIDGLKGPITLTAEGLPPGVTCPPVVVAEKETSVRIVLAASAEAKEWSGTVRIVGKAKSGDREISGTARTGSLVVGTGDYNTSRLRTRLEKTTAVSASGSEVAPARIDAGNDRKFSVVMGQKLEIPVKVLSRNGVKGNLAISPVGLRGLSRPPTINIAEKDQEGKLTLNFTEQRNVFAPEVGTWNFVLKATGTASYARIPESIDEATKEQQHIEALFKKYTDAASKAKAEADAEKKKLETAQKNLATASPDAKPGLEESVAAAKASLARAEEAAKSADAKLANATAEKAAAAKRLADTKKLAAAKDLKFATWSLPVTVEVKPAPEKPAKK